MPALEEGNDDKVSSAKKPSGNWVRLLTDEHKEMLILRLMETLTEVRDDLAISQRDQIAKEVSTQQQYHHDDVILDTKPGFHALYPSIEASKPKAGIKLSENDPNQNNKNPKLK